MFSGEMEVETMLVQSTGLGKTVLEAHMEDFSEVEVDDQKYIQVIIQSTNPVRWHITARMTGNDIRQFVVMVFKHIFLMPKIFWYMAFK
jgi:hypothetical protein